MLRRGAVLSVILLAGCASSGPVPSMQVGVIQAREGNLPTSREDCRYLGRTDVRTLVADRTQTAFSWDADPKFAAYLESLRTRASKRGANLIVVGEPREAEFGSEGSLAASMFSCQNPERPTSPDTDRHRG